MTEVKKQKIGLVFTQSEIYKAIEVKFLEIYLTMPEVVYFFNEESSTIQI